MTSALLSRLARSRITRGLSVVLALGFPLNAPLLGQTTSPDSISIVSGLVCEGGSETFPVSITLPPDTIIDKVDVFFLFDDTGSFAGFVPTVTTIFSGLVGSLETALPAVSFGFGVGRFEDYGGPGTGFSGELATGRPFTLNQPIVTAATAGGAAARDTLITTALSATAPGFGGDGPESDIEALSQVATGAGFDGNGNASNLDSGPAGAAATQTAPGTSGDVPAFSSNVGVTSGTLGGAGWRSGALHLVILATDVCSISPFPAGFPIPAMITGAGTSVEPVTAFACTSTTPGASRFGFVSDSKTSAGNTVAGAIAPSGSATVQATVTALNSLGIRVLGMGPGATPTAASGPSFDESVLLSALARLTGAVDGVGTPLVFSTSVPLGDLSAAIVDAIETTASLPVDITLSNTALPAGLSLSFSPSQVDDVPPGGTASFDLTLTGDGTPINGTFDVNFVDVNSGAVLGTIPVTLACPINQPPVAVCANVTVPASALSCLADASVDNGSFDPDGDVITIAQEPAGPFGPGSTPVVLTVTDPSGASSSCTAVVTVIDDTPPALQCVESVNPSLKNVPKASNTNEDGFYLVTATDGCSASTIAIGSFPLANNETIKITQRPGGAGVTLANTMGQGDIKHFLVGPGDAVITATDASGNVTSVSCLVPPPPK